MKLLPSEYIKQITKYFNRYTFRTNIQNPYQLPILLIENLKKGKSLFRSHQIKKYNIPTFAIHYRLCFYNTRMPLKNPDLVLQKLFFPHNIPYFRIISHVNNGTKESLVCPSEDAGNNTMLTIREIFEESKIKTNDI
jgi:hypothetical protein